VNHSQWKTRRTRRLLGDSVPTLPLLTRLAKALDASLTIDLDGDTSPFVFTGHGGPEPDDVPSGRNSPAA
jgi:hypothetical protein